MEEGNSLNTGQRTSHAVGRVSLLMPSAVCLLLCSDTQTGELPDRTVLPGALALFPRETGA